MEGGGDIQQSVELDLQLKELGADMIYCSSGGNVPHAKMPIGPGYQTPFAEQIRRVPNILTSAVGMITSPVQAEHIIVTRQAEPVMIARELLRDPHLPLRTPHAPASAHSWPIR